jgi:hypothetical protein
MQLMIMLDQYFPAYRSLSFHHPSNRHLILKLLQIRHLAPHHILLHSPLPLTQSHHLRYLNIIDSLGTEDDKNLEIKAEVVVLPIKEDTYMFQHSANMGFIDDIILLVNLLA